MPAWQQMTNRLSKHLIVLIIASLSIACNETPDPPLRLASSPWPGYEPFYLGRDLGFIDEKTVNIFELPSADITMESFRNHSTDLATLTLDETLELLHDGTKLRIVLVMDISHGGDAVLAKPDIQSLSDIKGKRISIVNIPLGMFMLSRLLEHANLTRKDVTVYPMSESKQLEFYRQNKADIIITFEPVKTKLLEAGAQVIFDSTQIPNEIFDILVVHEDAYQKRRDEICALVKGWFRSLDYIKNHSDDAAQRITKRLGLEVKDFDNLMAGIILPSTDENRKILGGKEPELIKAADKLARIMLEEQMLTSHVNAGNAIDTSFASCY